MTADPRAALSVLVAALQHHLELAAVGHGEDDPDVIAAYERIAEAFSDYDDALMDAYGEVTPLEVYDDDLVEDDDDDLDDEADYDDDDDDLDDDDDADDEEYDDDDDDDDDDRTSYLGLDDEEYDIDDSPRG